MVQKTRGDFKLLILDFISLTLDFKWRHSMIGGHFDLSKKAWLQSQAFSKYN
jgi:hypothetical protein